jgi:hypothetical protein
MPRASCANCGQEWDTNFLNQCPKCTSKDIAWKVTAPSAPYRPEGASTGVYISGIDLPWGDVFAIAFKFCVVLALFQAAFLIVAVLLWR